LRALSGASSERGHTWLENLFRNTGNELYQQEITFQSQLFDEIEVFEKLLQIHFTLYLGPSCLAVCERLQQKLPRELRDMIYGYLLDTRTVHFDWSWSFFMFKNTGEPKPEYIENEPGIIPGPRILSVGYLADTCYVGKAMRNELAEAYYRGTVFSFPEYGSCLENILFHTMDPWYIGAELSGLVKNVEISTNSSLTVPDGLPITELPHLLGLQTGILINIKLEGLWRSGCIIDKTVAVAAGKLFPLLNELQAEGHNVTIEMKSQYRHYGWERYEEPRQLKLTGEDVTANKLKLALRNITI
jgi:hypothetical protein